MRVHLHDFVSMSVANLSICPSSFHTSARLLQTLAQSPVLHFPESARVTRKQHAAAPDALSYGQIHNGGPGVGRLAMPQGVQHAGWPPSAPGVPLVLVLLPCQPPRRCQAASAQQWRCGQECAGCITLSVWRE